MILLNERLATSDLFLLLHGGVGSIDELAYVAVAGAAVWVVIHLATRRDS